MKGIAMAGNVIVDKIKEISAYPNIGNLTKILTSKNSVGGLVANVGIDVKRIDPDVPVYAFGRIGDDDDGRYVVKVLNENGVNTEYINRGESSTTYTDVMSVIGGQRTFFSYMGESAVFGYDDIPFDKAEFAYLHLGYFLLLDKVDRGDGIKILKEAKRRGIKTSIDLVSENSNRYGLIIPCLEYTDNLIINEIEAEQLSGENRDDMYKMCVKLKQLGVSERVIIHRTERSALYDGKEYLELPSLSVPEERIKGTTGAGDAYCAGCLTGIYKGRTNAEVLDFASRSAAVSLSEANSIDGMKSEKEIFEATKDYKRRI